MKARRPFFIFCSLLILPCFLYSQNIIPNGSFETYTACPNSANTNSPDEVKKATGWYSIKQTPDYFHTCATSSIVGVPNNFLGSQTTASGNAYTGLWAYQNGNVNFREIMAAKLSTTLSIGQKYFIKLTISLSEGYNSNCGVDKVGMRFSTVQHTLSAPPPINNFAHLYFNTIMADTLNWKSIFSAFIADSNYVYVEVGNFFTDANTNVQVLKPGANWAYYYIDDICLSSDSLEALGYSATAINDKNSLNLDQQNIFYPKPTSKTLFSKINLDGGEIMISDIYGRLISNYTAINHNEIEFYNIPNGLYIITFKKETKTLTEKIIINN